MQVPSVLLKPIARLAGKAANLQLKHFLLAHKKTAEMQDRLLTQVVEAHTDTDFGRDHDLKAVKSYEDFTAAVPLQSYQTIKPYIDKVLQGQSTALIPPDDKVLMFSLTSGTTGQPKHIPVTKRFATDIPKDEIVRLIKSLESQMKTAAKNLEFEKAALIRDQIMDLRRAMV